MDTLIPKIIVTPLLMWLVSLIARRWGNLAGGLAAGLPITSAPISVYLALDNGVAFAATAAASSLIGLAAVSVSYVAYAWAAKRYRVLVSALVAALVFTATGLLLQAANSLLPAILLTLVSLALLLVITRPDESHRLVAPKRSRWDMSGRIGASLVLVLGVTCSASLIGPQASGFLSPLPVVAWPLIVFAHGQGGARGAQAAVRGTSIGIPGVLIFYAIVLLHVEQGDLISTYAAAFLLSGIGVLIGIYLLRLSAPNRRPLDGE